MALNFVHIGYIKKTFGSKGELVFSIDTEFNIENLKVSDWIFIEIDSEYIPLQIETIIIKQDDSFIAKLIDVSANKASKYTGLSFYLPASEHETKSRENPHGSSLMANRSMKGFEVIDKTYGNIGILEEIISKTGQDLLQITFKDKMILIPVNEDIILKIDRKKRIVKIAAPEGLIDFYLDA